MSSKDVLFLKRTPTVTYAGGPIPEQIKKCYEQQQLPIRKQSLAANVAERKKQARNLFNKTKFNLSVDSFAEEDEFDFNDRPPSFIIAIRPVELEQEEEKEILVMKDAPDNDHWRNGSVIGGSMILFKPLLCVLIHFLLLFC